MQRSRTGKRLELTARDLDIFRLLSCYRYLSAPTIHAFVGGVSRKRFTERLGDLYHEGYLDRPQRQWEMADCRHRPVVYELDAGARRVIAEHAIVPEPRTWLGIHAQRQFSHAVLICEVLASIEIGAQNTPGLRWISWSEILGKLPDTTATSATPYALPGPAGPLIPDALFGLEYDMATKKTYRFFALEVDRATMPVSRTNPYQSSLLKKLETYRARLCESAYRSHWGLPNLLVLTVTTSESRVGFVVEKLAPMPQFLFKCFDEKDGWSMSQQFWTTPWLRAGHPPLHIGAS